MLVSIAQPKTKPKSKPAIKKLVKEDNRQSVAQYPTLSGEADGLDMSDAIPYWTQPKIVGGNWDDVRSALSLCTSSSLWPFLFHISPMFRFYLCFISFALVLLSPLLL